MSAFIVGDIHGCLDQLKELIQGVDRNTTRIISCGDLIDRGPDSRGVINFIRGNNIEAVCGNHELMMIECKPFIVELMNGQELTPRYMYDLASSDWFYNGGKDVFTSYNGDYKAMYKDILFLESLPTVINTGIIDDQGLELRVSHTWTSYISEEVIDNRKFDAVWNRDQAIGYANSSKYYNVHGHTPVDYVLGRKATAVPEPVFSDGVVNIDTGAPYKSFGRGYLTGISFPSLEVKQVKTF